ncbi:uncharacterized protein PpBr36_09361 [Pyricularia pennisetigena]|uniref:uncharacterized protein n=1 Tax=Pyricularia pennisetigena TaxID=1578925 RepID=UPI0011525BF5|nr:uncharacterized protein PpBr36_09361 [Pyricularia pennisetigena]TLS21767.1 hypothetical protein PpBr36_09361 [Pyricularia pennisetigena]
MSHRSIDRPSPEGGTAAGILVQTSDESLTVCEGDGRHMELIKSFFFFRLFGNYYRPNSLNTCGTSGGGLQPQSHGTTKQL